MVLNRGQCGPLGGGGTGGGGGGGGGGEGEGGGGANTGRNELLVGGNEHHKENASNDRYIGAVCMKHQ